MIDFETLQSISLGLVYVILGIVLLLIAKFINDLTTPYSITDELTEKDNPALGVTLAGYFAGCIAIFVGAIIGPDTSSDQSFYHLLLTVGIDVGYALGGILALNLGRWVVDKLVLTSFSTTKEIIEDQNIGTGAVEGASYFATGLIIAGAIAGDSGGPITAVIFFILGQIVLILFARFYQFITQYDIHAEIERDNVAAGTSLGFSIIAMAIIVLKGTSAEFESWVENLTWFGIDICIGFVALLILRRITDWAFLPGTTLQHEIEHDRNMNAAWIEGIIAIGLAVLIFFLL